MSEMVERVARSIYGEIDMRGEAYKKARGAIETMRDLDPHVAARAADRLGIHPSDVTRLVGTWSILIDEALK